MLGRKRRAHRVLALLDDCAREIRGLVAVAADPVASYGTGLAAAFRRVESAVEALTEGGSEGGSEGAATGTAQGSLEHAGRPAEPVLAHLHGLERALADLAEPLRTPSRSPLVRA
jgi:hypothetical protein